MFNSLDLNVSSPEEVSVVLRKAAECFHESQSELRSAWQDPNAGREWGIIARKLEDAADRIDKALSR